MKTITKNYNVYTFDELSQEAKDKARNNFIAQNEYYFLPDNMNERLHELLEENNIEDLNNTKPTQVLYSLSCCQGDGAMFEGVFLWKGYTIEVRHSGNYCHYNSKTIVSITREDADVTDEEHDRIYEKFNDLYISICKELERYGYNYIEYEDSEEYFAETCEANGYTFLESGEMFNN